MSFEHWGRSFEIRGFLPGGALGFQDHVLLQRRPDGEPLWPPLAARPRLPAQGAPANRVMDALIDARTHRSGAVAAQARFGISGSLLRRMILRTICPYTAHEDKFDDAVATSINELTQTVEHLGALLRRLQDRSDDA